ncbi:YhfC family intramembrane metalloprotease [Pyxidicoccus parkwayensis]|uniref:YhfC family intramembrane metalloprotease n=1 Tax=Pyxidicoccus parkwayensis TaxID=2813578 RepID=A0ABX7P2G3_9BACT|nr:YhfC family glutamic-type intramembrane protease [Pyxidicoccus parkwaysis]QSQ23513.1 YhfC family intramembrane metalloprotease [Pyxidicoccus parkwaysis]
MASASGVNVGAAVGLGVAIVFDVLLPVAAVLWARRKLGVAWKVVGWGAAAFALSQLFTRVPLVQLLQYVLRDELKSSQVFMAVWMVILCVTAGLFEETARLLAFRGPLKDFRRWKDAVGFGVGHGGLESALLVGGMSVVALINMVALAHMDPSTLKVPPDVVEQVQKAKDTFAAMRWWEPLLGAWERLAAMVFHVAMSVVVLQRFVRGQVRWYWLAVVLHTLFNGVGVGVAQLVGPLAAEGAVTVAALLGLWLLLRLRPREPEPMPAASAA